MLVNAVVDLRGLEPQSLDYQIRLPPWLEAHVGVLAKAGFFTQGGYAKERLAALFAGAGPDTRLPVPPAALARGTPTLALFATVHAIGSIHSPFTSR